MHFNSQNMNLINFQDRIKQYYKAMGGVVLIIGYFAVYWTIKNVALQLSDRLLMMSIVSFYITANCMYYIYKAYISKENIALDVICTLLCISFSSTMAYVCFEAMEQSLIGK